MTATDHDDATAEKSTDTAPVSKNYPDEWRGVRYSADPHRFFGWIESGWCRVELDSLARESESTLSVDVRYKESDPETIRDIDFLIAHDDGDGTLEAAATVDPDTAVELALSILDEVNGEL